MRKRNKASHQPITNVAKSSNTVATINPYFAALLTALALSGCAASSTAGSGPTCDEFLHLDDRAMEAAIVEWARENDARVDPAKPREGLSGFAVFQDRASLITYCQNADHRSQHIGDLKIAPGG